jgi:hypothetical protein
MKHCQTVVSKMHVECANSRTTAKGVDPRWENCIIDNIGMSVGITLFILKPPARGAQAGTRLRALNCIRGESLYKFIMNRVR